MLRSLLTVGTLLCMQEPDDFEEQVAQALFDLEATNSELKADLRDLYITSAKEIDVQNGSRKAIIVQVIGSVQSRLSVVTLTQAGRPSNGHVAAIWVVVVNGGRPPSCCS